MCGTGPCSLRCCWWVSQPRSRLTPRLGIVVRRLEATTGAGEVAEGASGGVAARLGGGLGFGGAAVGELRRRALWAQSSQTR